ncbi:hypothetical protein ES703_113728 [subsurface metagenome]
MESATRIGRLARPSRIKGRGFGIMYSIVERNSERAASRATRFSFLEAEGINLFLCFSLDGYKDPVRQTGDPLAGPGDCT